MSVSDPPHLAQVAAPRSRPVRTRDLAGATETARPAEPAATAAEPAPVAEPAPAVVRAPTVEEAPAPERAAAGPAAGATARAAEIARAVATACAARPAPAARPVPARRPRSAYVLVAAGAALIPWLVVLASVQQRWTVTWVGLDAMEALGLVATGLLTLRAHPMRAVVASVTAALLALDAWFDLTTSPAGALLPAVLMATLAELPLAALCGYHAVKTAGQARR